MVSSDSFFCLYSKYIFSSFSKVVSVLLVSVICSAFCFMSCCLYRLRRLLCCVVVSSCR